MRTIKLCLILSLLLSGCGHQEQAGVVTLYEYQGQAMASFMDVTVYEKRTGYIKFKCGDVMIEHSGGYSIQSPSK
jgi:hypothetical protein